jgi:hypothetical protein
MKMWNRVSFVAFVAVIGGRLWAQDTTVLGVVTDDGGGRAGSDNCSVRHHANRFGGGDSQCSVESEQLTRR